MSGVAAQKKDTLLGDMQVMYYLVEHANREHSPITKSGLFNETTFKDDKEKWGHDEKKFNTAYDALIKGGHMRETSEKVKMGMFKSEHTLEAVKLPEKVREKSGIEKDIEDVRKTRPNIEEFRKTHPHGGIEDNG